MLLTVGCTVSDEEAGPAPPPGLDKPKKKRKVLEFQQVYLDSLPSASMYERSFMHQNTVTHVQWTKSNFLVTASAEGHVKFWKKKVAQRATTGGAGDAGGAGPSGAGEIEFIKRYCAHVGPVTALAASKDGIWLASISAKDSVVCVFDVVNFDMVNRIQLEFRPSCIEWVHASSSTKPAFAVGSLDDGDIRIMEAATETGAPRSVVKIHRAPVSLLRLHVPLNALVSTDSKGILELWDVDTHKQPAAAGFKYKSDTDLYELAKNKTRALSLDVSPDGSLFACVCADQQIRLWHCLSGKLYKKIDESLAAACDAQAADNGPSSLEALDFGKRMSVEKDFVREVSGQPEVAS